MRAHRMHCLGLRRGIFALRKLLVGKRFRHSYIVGVTPRVQFRFPLRNSAHLAPFASKPLAWRLHEPPSPRPLLVCMPLSAVAQSCPTPETQAIITRPQQIRRRLEPWRHRRLRDQLQELPRHRLHGSHHPARLRADARPLQSRLPHTRRNGHTQLHATRRAAARRPASQPSPATSTSSAQQPAVATPTATSSSSSRTLRRLEDHSRLHHGHPATYIQIAVLR